MACGELVRHDKANLSNPFLFCLLGVFEAPMKKARMSPCCHVDHKNLNFFLNVQIIYSIFHSSFKKSRELYFKFRSLRRKESHFYIRLEIYDVIRVETTLPQERLAACVT